MAETEMITDQTVRHMVDEGNLENVIDAAEVSEPLAPPPVVEYAAQERDFATDEAGREGHNREKKKRRHSHTQRESKHASYRRRESETSTKERPALLSITSARLSGSPKSKRRDSITERDAVRGKERVREVEKANSNSDKERAYPEYRSSRHRESRGEEKYSKRRRAEKERTSAEESARMQAEEEALRQERRERRRAAKQAEEELIRAEQERRRAHEERKMAREEEERRIRHEKRRQRHEAEKEARRLELERIEKLELEVLEAKRLRRQKRTGRERSTTVDSTTIEEPIDMPRDADRRTTGAADEVIDVRPSTPPPIGDESPRNASRRRLSTREPPPVKRGSLFGGIFGRSKADAVTPPRSSRPEGRARIDTSGRPKTATRTPQREKERPTSSHHSSSDARHRGDRPHRSRRESNTQRPRRIFQTQEEEAEYYRRKESRRSTRPRENKIPGDRDVGVSFASQVEEVPAPPPEPSEPGPGPEPDRTPEPHSVFEDESPLIEDAAGVVGVPSTSSSERHERRRSRRASALESRPRTRRVSIIDKEQPMVRRVEVEQSRTRDRGEERARPRRGEAERRSGGTSSRKKRDEPGGLKSLFGGLKKIIS